MGLRPSSGWTQIIYGTVASFRLELKNYGVVASFYLDPENLGSCSFLHIGVCNKGL